MTEKKPSPDPRPFGPSAELPITLLCPYCKSPLQGERTVRCSVCGTAHHSACWKEHGSCSLLNCPGKPEISIPKRQLIAALTILVIVSFAVTWLFVFHQPARQTATPRATVVNSPVPPSVPCTENSKNQELLEAARYNQTERIKQIIVSHQNIDTPGHVTVFWKNDRCWTPLFTASYFGSSEVARMLLQAGANLEKTDEYNRTPLLVAVQGNHPETIDLLLAAHANVNASDQSGDTSLLYSVIRGNQDVIRDLLHAGAKVNLPDFMGYTPLILAIRAKQWDAARILIEAKADPNLGDKNGRSALSWACENAELPIVQAILNAGASVNSKDSNGTTPLMWATRAHKTEVVKLLIHAGADIQAADMQGNTALTYAQKAYEKEIIQILSGGRR